MLTIGGVLSEALSDPNPFEYYLILVTLLVRFEARRLDDNEQLSEVEYALWEALRQWFVTTRPQPFWSERYVLIRCLGAIQRH